MIRNMIGITMTQMDKKLKYDQVSIREGVKKYGQKAIDVVLSEYTHLDYKTIFDPQNTGILSLELKKWPLILITIVK